MFAAAVDCFCRPVQSGHARAAPLQTPSSGGFFDGLPSRALPLWGTNSPGDIKLGHSRNFGNRGSVNGRVDGLRFTSQLRCEDITLAGEESSHNLM